MTDWPARSFGEKITGVLVEREAFTAEISTDKVALDGDLLGHKAKRACHLISQVERGFIRRMYVNDAVPIDPDERRAWFDVACVPAWRFISMLEDAMGVCEDRL
jgi:hypothetical protein